MDFPNIIASFGVSLLLIGFFLNVFQLLNEKSFTYILLNLLGAAISCYASWLIQFIPFVILEGIWGAVAFGGLVKKLYR